MQVSAKPIRTLSMISCLLLFGFIGRNVGLEMTVSDELIGLLQAPVTQQFESPVHMHRHVASYVDRLFDENSDHFSRQHSFIVSFKETFDLSQLTSLLTRERLEVVGNRHYRVAMKPSTLRSFVEEHSESITSVVPVVPAMKIERSVYNMSSDCNPPTSAAIIAETAALPPKELEALQLWLDGMSTDQSLPFEYDKSAMLPDTRRLVQFSTSCEKIVKLAKFLAENSEIIWIEKAKQMKHTNFWARGNVSSCDACSRNLSQV